VHLSVGGVALLCRQTVAVPRITVGRRESSPICYILASKHRLLIPPVGIFGIIPSLYGA
jgi:hypothetical protein